MASTGAAKAVLIGEAAAALTALGTALVAMARGAGAVTPKGPTREDQGAPSQARDVHVVLCGRPALRDTRLTVHRGDLLGLLGPNGAGKTTLLRAVLGLVPLAGGDVLVDGLPPARTRRLVGYVPQRHEFAWDFPIDIAGAVLSGRTRSIGWLRRARPADRAAVEEALELVGLADLRRRPVGELSGGQRHRVLVARALADGPQLLLLDEPFTERGCAHPGTAERPLRPPGRRGKGPADDHPRPDGPPVPARAWRCSTAPSSPRAAPSCWAIRS
ncbi:ATP-binding cassette domain-containing protein [Streptomyces sp. NPDC049915]|uniref:metal ABC transporter ATP-binding protein n=1 Tax=Streptomyces sp. NPDC049915 TaxID=3155510 RepID=UPI00343AEB3C